MNFYKPVSNKPDFNSLEEEVIEFWKKNEIFKKSIELREDAPEFKFYEGPPTANGKPGVHHVLARTFKDLVCRYQTMRGKKVERNAGWDEHGLPVEIEVEKQQGFTNDRSKKEQIEELGIAEFNRLCAESTQKYIGEWEKLTERMAYWVDFSKAYRTSDPKYIESVWSIVKKLNDKGLLYKGNKVVPWACDSGTVVSQAEVAQGYKDVVDETAYVKFKLTAESAQRVLGKIQSPHPQPLSQDRRGERETEVFMLAWTTTPWTLPSNMALAVGPDIKYVVCRRKDTSDSPNKESSHEKLEISRELEIKMIEAARRFRKEPTKSEAILWEALRNKQFEDRKFRRQEPIGPFVVDFYCSSERLIVEVDGGVHETQKEADAERQQLLEASGLRFVRLSADLVEKNLEKALEEVKKAFCSPIPNPSPIKGEGSKNNFKDSPLATCGRGAGGEGYIILSEKRWKAVLGEAEWEVAGEMKGLDFARQKKTKGLFRLLDNEGNILEVRYYSPHAIHSLNSYEHVFEKVAKLHGASPNSFEDNIIEQIFENADNILGIKRYSIPPGAYDADPLQSPRILPPQLVGLKLEIQYKEVKDTIDVIVENSSHGDREPNFEERNYQLLKCEYENLFNSKSTNKIVLGLNGFETNETFVIDDPDSGTGIVHIAPAFGQDDFECYKANNIQEEIINAVNSNGTFNEQAPDFLQGQSIFNENKKTNQQEFTRINKIIIKHLDEKGLLHKTEKYEHSYPHNWRTNNPLIYYLRPSWYVATSKIKDELIAANQQVNWYPAHVKEGRFGQWLENNIDWSISRERFWGTPLPIWQNSKGDFQVIGSFDELVKKTNTPLLDKKGAGGGFFNPHKPYIDEISWTDEHCETWKRVPEVLDCWFDSGSMPVAANGVNPPENFVTADYICEAVDQTRGWFYTLLALAVGLSSGNGTRPPYKNVLCLGHILDKDGQKMSKSKGNVINPWELFAKFGADPVRWFMVSACSAGNPVRFDESGINEVMRRFILPLWNTYAFYVLYANLDEVTTLKLENAPGELLERQVQPIDVWIIARLNETHRQVTSEYEQFEFSKAAQLIEKFVDELSNVWVRANRSRFWNTSEVSSNRQSELDSAPKTIGVDLAAYRTLHTCLLSVCKLAAPFIPLITENIYQNLKSSESRESVHLTDWIMADTTTEIEEALVAEMATAQEVVNIGRALRQELKLKIRQPLSQVILAKSLKIDYFRDLVLSELNVKEIVFEEIDETSAPKVRLNTVITHELLSEGLARELIHSIQGLRKNSGLDVSDRIELFVDFKGHEEIATLIRTQKDYVLGEVLALNWQETAPKANNKKIKLEGKEIEIGLCKLAEVPNK